MTAKAAPTFETAREVAQALADRGPVRVHRNLFNGLWAVSQKGRILAYSREVCLVDVGFVVCESMRQRWTVKLGRRKVHAWATGVLVAQLQPGRRVDTRYDLFNSGRFVTPSGPVASATDAHFTAGQRMLTGGSHA